IIAADADIARRANRHVRLLELLGAFLHLPVGLRHPGAQPRVLCPRVDDEPLDEAAVLLEIAEHTPAAGAVPPAYGFDLVDRLQERRAIFRRAPILDLDTHRARSEGRR